MDLPAVQRHVGLVLQTLEQGFLLQILAALGLHGGQQIGGGLHIDTAVIAVQHRQLAVPVSLKIHADQGGDVHGAGQNGGVAVGRAIPGDEAQQLGLVQLHGLAGGQVVGHQDNGVVAQQVGLGAAGENIHHPLRNVLHVGGTGLHIGVVHGGKGGGEILAGDGGGILSGGALGLDDVLDGLQIILVLQHHLVDFKDGGVFLTHLVQRLLIQGAQLLLGLLAGGPKARPLPGRGAAGFDGGGLLLAEHAQGTNGDAVQNGFTGRDLHMASLFLLQRYRFSWKNVSIAAKLASSSPPSTVTVTV